MTSRALEVLRQPPAGLVTDLDGTISPLAPTPAEAGVSPGCLRALESLARLLDVVAIVSGRPATEAREKLGLDGLLYIGNHGLETWEKGRLHVRGDAQAHAPQVRRALREVSAGVRMAGVTFEDKGVTASIHYRNATDPPQARRLILAAASSSPSASGLRVVEGKMVVELRPPLAVDKGTALSDLVAQRRLKGVVYLGDDVTDRDAFESLRRMRETEGPRSLSVCVGGAETPPEVAAVADHTVDGVSAVEELLAALVESLGKVD